MDYEKLYKEAFERARDLYNGAITVNDNNTTFAKNLIEEIFPELKEKEDNK